MNHSRRVGDFARSLFLLLATILWLFASPSAGYAQEQPTLKASFARDANQIVNIDLVVGQSRAIELDEEYNATQFSGEKIVSVVPFTAKILIINAVGIGQAQVTVAKTLTIPNQSQQTLVFRVFVQKDLSLIDNQLKILYPKENIQLSQVNDSVVISGSVTRAEIVEDINQILKAANVAYSNLLRKPATSTQQVQMEVRIAEVNRRAVREIGTAFGIMNRTIPVTISPNGLGSPLASGGLGKPGIVSVASGAMNLFLGRPDLTSAFIRALQERGAIRSLAEPNIIAAHGETGKFQSGGKIPVPQVTAASGGQSGFNVQFQDYGVMLEFTPNIKDENHIIIKIRTEVSDIDPTKGVTTNSITIPALVVNTASTVLELADGQSFALAGLLNNRESVNTSSIPGLANIPLLGELFKSRSFQRNESELMFLCTVRMVVPLNPDQIPRLPGAPLNNATGPAKPDSNSSGAALAPILNTAPSSLSFPTTGTLEGESGHVVPRKVVKAKTDN